MSTALLNIGTRSLAAAQGTLTTVAHNIANANTDGYSRQQAQLATAGGLYTGAGFFGRGVDLTTVRRQYDQFLTGAVQSAASVSGADNARAEGLAALDSLFGDSTLGIGAALDDLFGAAGDLANRPADLSARQVFLARAGQLAQRLTAVGRELESLVRAADARLAQGAGEVNSQLTAIQRLNGQIAQAQASGQPPNDLLDQRDAALLKLQEQMAVRSVPQDDGSISLFTPGGAPLLVGSQRATLEVQRDPDDASRSALQLRTGNTSRWMDAGELGGGALAGTLRLRDQDLAGALLQVGRIAHVVASAVNQQQSQGLDMDGDAGAPLFTVPGPVAVAKTGYTGTATVVATISDPKLLQASDYEVAWSGSDFRITRLADGESRDGLSMDGLTFASAGPIAPGDSWRIKSVAAAATGLAVNALHPRQLATALPATAEAGTGNQGSGRIASVQQVATPADPDLQVKITFNDPPTSYRVGGVDHPYAAGQPIPASGDHNGWVLTLEGQPAAGDSFTLRRVTQPAADNRNALALQGLGSRDLIDGSTLNGAYATLLGDVGTRVQAARDAADVSGRLQAEALARQQNVSGVNLDEEAANLLRFQQAYQASARIVQASQSLFDALLSATGR